jgi:hypothetical protein
MTDTSTSKTRHETIQRLLDGYSSLSVPTLLSPLSSRFTHQVLPKSLGMPVRDKDSFAQHATGIFSIFSQFSMVPQSINDDPSTGVVTIHAKMLGTLRKGGGGEGGKWENECIMLVRLSGDGREVEAIEEFVDSAKALEMGRRFKPRDFGARMRMWMGSGNPSWHWVVVNQLVAVGCVWYLVSRTGFASSWLRRVTSW